MKQEVVQDFLNLVGIVGFALMHGRSRPYFCGMSQSLNFQQREALARGIQQVVETTPDSFENFEFQFNEYRVYLYKLEHGAILLVLASHELVYSSYADIIQQLKVEVQSDVAGAIDTFRSLVSVPTLSGQAYWKSPAETTSSTQSANASVTPISPTSTGASKVSQPSKTVDAPTLNEVLSAMNHLSQFTTQYLGNTVVANYWKTTRPAGEWVEHFQIDRLAHITCIDFPPHVPITSDQQTALQSWVAAFIAQCTKVIRDYPKRISQALDERQTLLLLPKL